DPSINTLGYSETLDALAAVAFCTGKAPDTQVGVVGYSMGGAVALLAAARDQRIRAVVADSPFASQRRVIQRHFRRRTRLPSFPFLSLVELFLPYDPEQVEPINEVARIAPRALMLIHGSSDAVTDPLDSEALYRAAGDPKEMWALPGVTHVGAYFQDRTTYVTRVAEFFERHLTTAPTD
ncbi:MAG: alpha/beta fold hydrolase, partial [Chloroflexota bacterium]|nr:alpha/beta fold hydrolase [Chloroflexota bacterium]